MIKNNQRFTIAIIVAGLLMCASIMAYFTFMAPHADMPDLAKMKGTADSQTQHQPAPEPAAPSPVAPNTAPAKPVASPPPVTFTPEKTEAVEPETEFKDKTVGATAELPPTRLTPDMFVFATLPFDAPVAEFPLVLVGQKSLEWTKTPTGDRGGISGGSGSTIYRRPPPPPAPPPNPPPNPPPPPPVPPPNPPPEVSPSGL